MGGFIYPYDPKIRNRIFTGRKRGILFTTGVISKDLRPSANILRHHRRWGSWSFLGIRCNSRICCWTRDIYLRSISKSKVAVSEFVSVSAYSLVSEDLRNLILNPSLIKSSICDAELRSSINCAINFWDSKIHREKNHWSSTKRFLKISLEFDITLHIFQEIHP